MFDKIDFDDQIWPICMLCIRNEVASFDLLVHCTSVQIQHLEFPSVRFEITRFGLFYLDHKTYMLFFYLLHFVLYFIRMFQVPLVLYLRHKNLALVHRCCLKDKINIDSSSVFVKTDKHYYEAPKEADTTKF